MQISDILTRTVDLSRVSSTPRLDLELLVCHVINRPRSFLFSHPEYTLTEKQALHLESLLKHRLIGHPIAHLTGSRDFWSLELLVEPSTLIPRPDTEILVEQALECCDHRPRQVLDLGTGTGAIALALASERPGWEVFGCDRIPEAVELARKNATHNKLERVQFLESNWFAELPEQTFDLIVSNPPYIRDDDPHLSQGDVRFEPVSALTSGSDGLDDIRHIAQESIRWLNDDGWLMVEHGYDQGEDVRRIFTENGFKQVSTAQDLSGHDRITRGVKQAI
ncbi:peptide chain release factor N(5)-glutamine methyltransferase [Sansalvadorimonas sp. 2012CJ34-2]|uniref:Release factor glutamine methyltransferase n=1 Tax=Parendozoicomonas callyspongiae TaxID=2942213 RepID=A0ABT0PG70_9GAMM|nr:peptide chain release factor N(5)-glutamine methyltransferase [Sansalvadorimonas sp. 2012CJ34-2]MCL6270338.1 peptide chain release factor N(5)-glutamine methyltransferase [Sansalvadorimonas sp. 2012CJ34-2]